MLNHQIESFSAEQIRAVCVAMLSVAHLHGLHDAEIALISDFWSSSPQLGSFDATMVTAFEPKHFTSVQEKELVIDLCLACAFADGRYSSEEKVQIANLASQLGLSEADVAERTDSVRLAFLGSLAHLPDSQSVAALSQSLK